MSAFIDKIGVEVEGFWNPGNLPDPMPGRRTSDGSVSGEVGYAAHEYVSDPFSDLVALQDWLRRIYPAKVNQTCGLHAHFSFKNAAYYSRIIDSKFDKFFHDEMTSWAKRWQIKNKHFYSRLDGSNHFCARKWKPYEQMILESKDPIRYSQWNFCWKMHQTAECRLLPTFKDPKIACAAIAQLRYVIEKYLSEYPVSVAFTAKLEQVDRTIPEHLAQIMRS